MNGYTIFIAQPLLRFCDDFIIIIQTSMFDFKQSKNNIKIYFDNNQLPLKLSPTEWKLATSRSEMEIHMNTTDNLEQFLPILRTASIFSGMSDSEILSVLHCMGAFVSDKEKDSYLLRAGDMTSTMGLLLSGSAIVIQEDVWGHRNIMAQILPGQTFAEPFAASNGTALNISVVVTKDCSLLYLDIHRILGVCPSACEYHTHLIQNLISVLAKKLLLFNEKITHMSKRTTKEKLLSYLSAEAQRQGSLSFDIPYDRQQLADYLCVERAAMSAELSRLQKQGLLTTNKNHFILQSVPDDVNADILS